MTRNVIVLIAITAIATTLSAQPAVAPKPIPRAQFLATMDAEFRKIDANHDGVITRAEVEAFQRTTALVNAAERSRTAFAALDTDKNGELSFAEFAKLASVRSAQVNGQPFIAQMDMSGDGKVTLLEHRTGTLANFDRMDTDKDGIVTAAEMKAAGLVR